jgi:hypothetical protein
MYEPGGSTRRCQHCGSGSLPWGRSCTSRAVNCIMTDGHHPVLPVDDPVRPSIRRAVFSTLWAVAVFFVFTVTKEMKPIYNHAPWLNDPYDTVISFTMFFVPLMAAFLVVQVSLCLRSEPLSVARVDSILRGCRVAIGAIVVELLSAWLAVVLVANQSQWTPGPTALQVGLLLVATVVASSASVRLAGVRHFSRHRAHQDEAELDWIGDAVAVARLESLWLGPLRRRGMLVLDWCERSLIREFRRHPVVAAAVASAGFGVAVFGWQGYREGYLASVTLLSMGLGFCGMYAFLLPAGSYFRLVRSINPLSGLRRRALDASVAASGAAILALAFRGTLWGIIGSNANTAGPAQFAIFEAAAILLAFTSTLLMESLVGSHARHAA